MARPFSLIAIAIGVFLLCSAVLDYTRFSSHASLISNKHSGSESINPSTTSSSSHVSPDSESVAYDRIEYDPQLPSSYAAPASGPINDMKSMMSSHSPSLSFIFDVDSSSQLYNVDSKQHQQHPQWFPIVFVKVAKLKTGEEQTFAFAPVQRQAVHG